MTVRPFRKRAQFEQFLFKSGFFQLRLLQFLTFSFMSKKQKNNKPVNEAPKIVDEQKEPCLRAVQKKVRNINKRLKEIADLQNRNDLKPEQIEKVQRKPFVIEQRDKYAEFLNLYQEIVTQNKKSYEQWKLSELREVAEVFVATQYGFKSDNPSAQGLVQVLQGPSSQGLTLEQRLNEVAQALIKVGQSSKLKTKARKYNEQNPLKLNQQSSEQKDEDSKSQNNLPLVTKQTIKEEENLPESKTEPVKQVIHEHHQQHKEESSANQIPSEQNVPENTQQKQSELPQNSQEPNQVPENAQKTEQPAAKQNGEANQNQKGKKPYQNNRNRRENGGRRNFNNRKEGGNQEGGQRKFRQNKGDKPYHKKRYQQKNPTPAPAQDDEDSSSLEKTPEPRQFKREEVRELIEDGFIVVGKPKPKAHDQKQYHDKTHGRKNHHHHKKANY